jgi:hypothetical protein
MLIPRFSLRWLLGLTTVCAVISLVLSYAVRGQPWALGVTAGLWCLVIVALLYVGSFLAAWLVAQITGAFRSPGTAAGLLSSQSAGENPFGPLASGTTQPASDDPPALTG